jgi:hypothetical protein
MNRMRLIPKNKALRMKLMEITEEEQNENDNDE